MAFLDSLGKPHGSVVLGGVYVFKIIISLSYDKCMTTDMQLKNQDLPEIVISHKQFNTEAFL